MSRTVAIGIQSFEKLRTNDYFYIDKTHFIKEWWEAGDDTTLITRPRRFGKTLNMDTLNCFFSTDYADRADLFEGLSIWEEEKYREMQGTYPVINLTFADIKTGKVDEIKAGIKQLIRLNYAKYKKITKSDMFDEDEKAYFKSVRDDMSDATFYRSINILCEALYRYYGKKPIVLLDEYDTPMQEAYTAGNWDEIVEFMRYFFNATFKTNQYLGRAVITGITRISKESIFSDLNHLEVITTSSDKYTTCFGFMEKEVKDSLEEYDLSNNFDEVKRWYDGFVIGKNKDIYNPWSIINYLDKKKLDNYWINSSGNRLINDILQKGDADTKIILEKLMHGESFEIQLNEDIVFSQLDSETGAVWSLMLASGYLKATHIEFQENDDNVYTLQVTNQETIKFFRNMVARWFRNNHRYNDFIKALMLNDVRRMNKFMNEVALDTFSSFDTGTKPSKSEPERFYHGFVLGLMVDLNDRYVITSNRESGFGRYDVMLEPRDKKDNAYIFEFKVFDELDDEKGLEDTIANAHKQIEDKKYETVLLSRGVDKDKIYKYGFAFVGKTVLIG